MPKIPGPLLGMRIYFPALLAQFTWFGFVKFWAKLMVCFGIWRCLFHQIGDSYSNKKNSGTKSVGEKNSQRLRCNKQAYIFVLNAIEFDLPGYIYESYEVQPPACLAASVIFFILRIHSGPKTTLLHYAMLCYLCATQHHSGPFFCQYTICHCWNKAVG